MDPLVYWYVVLILLVGAGVAWQRIGRPFAEDWGLRRRDAHEDVSSVPARDYVTHGAAQSPDAYVFPPPAAATAKNETPETPRDLASLDVNAIRYDIRAQALAALLAHGLIKDGRRTEAMRAVFGDISGQAYSRAAFAVRAYERRIVLDVPPAAPEPPRVTPIAGRELDPDVAFVEAP